MRDGLPITRGDARLGGMRISPFSLVIARVLLLLLLVRTALLPSRTLRLCACTHGRALPVRLGDLRIVLRFPGVGSVDRERRRYLRGRRARDTQVRDGLPITRGDARLGGMRISPFSPVISRILLMLPLLLLLMRPALLPPRTLRLCARTHGCALPAPLGDLRIVLRFPGVELRGGLERKKD